MPLQFQRSCNPALDWLAVRPDTSHSLLLWLEWIWKPLTSDTSWAPSVFFLFPEATSHHRFTVSDLSSLLSRLQFYKKKMSYLNCTTFHFGLVFLGWAVNVNSVLTSLNGSELYYSSFKCSYQSSITHLIPQRWMLFLPRSSRLIIIQFIEVKKNLLDYVFKGEPMDCTSSDLVRRECLVVSDIQSLNLRTVICLTSPIWERRPRLP